MDSDFSIVILGKLAIIFFELGVAKKLHAKIA